ncbi:MAG: imidazolonepropionase [Betaproteobacteria bacterium]|nr:imidazolonepropionase [Betaproteobacteria bacterium]
MSGERWDLLIRRARLATMAGDGYGALDDAALAVRDGRIAWLGPDRELPASATAAEEFAADGRWVTPGLIDCHTHLVYAGNRANEFEMRLTGATYADIARAGGGIVSTVKATRAASEQTLYAQAAPRLCALLAEGVTTIEIKSGYGLAMETEAKMLRVARRLGREFAVDVRTTFLGAHALPPEFAGRPDDYIDAVCAHMLPAIAAEGLADAVDAFCDNIGFTPAQTRRVFEAARALRLPVKLHAEQLSDQGGAQLAAEFGALSCDHLEYVSEAGVVAMARAGTVAVLLPGAFYFLRETRVPPVDLLRRHGVAMAIATDCNPGSSPITSLLACLNMACTLFRLTPAEALAGATRHAAGALGLADRGILENGRRADLALWNIGHPAELAYHLGYNPLSRVIRQGSPRASGVALLPHESEQ